MTTELLEVQPRELEFVFELKKKSSCSVWLVNKTDSPVAYKVKTTSPKKYSVRPNVGIVPPKATSYFKVTMQAQRAAPPNLRCRDKFLVQSSAVPEGTTDEDIVPSMFSKDDGKYVEETKLRAVLVSPPNSPVLSPINGVHQQMPAHEVPVVKDQAFDSAEIIGQEKIKSIEDTSLLSRDSTEDITLTKNKISEDISLEKNEIVEEVSLPNNNSNGDVSTQKMNTHENVTQLKDNNMESISAQGKVAEDEVESKMETCEVLVAGKSAEPGRVRSIEDLELVKAIEKMKSKLHELESKLTKAEVTISALTEQRRLGTRDIEALRKELVTLKSRSHTIEVEVGFPFLFVVLVALISIMLGHLVRC